MENNEEVVVDLDNEGEGETETDVVKLSKSEYEKMNQTLGSLKRELKDLKKPKEEPQETPEKTAKTDDALLQKVERIALRTAGITHQEDIELAQATAKKWGVDIDEVIADEDFQVKLKRQQDSRSNIEATSGVKGGNSGGSNAKNTPEYWQSKGEPPTAADVPDATTRRKIVREMLNASKGNGKMKFYNS